MSMPDLSPAGLARKRAEENTEAMMKEAHRLLERLGMSHLTDQSHAILPEFTFVLWAPVLHALLDRVEELERRMAPQ